MIATGARKAFIDTNMLLYIKSNKSPFHTTALKKLDDLLDQGVEVWISRQVIREYITNATRPTNPFRVSNMNDLILDIREIVSNFEVADETKDVTEHLLNILQKVTVQGSQIYDANIVATMQAYGIKEILTHNVADFTRYNAFITVLPLV
jgi:predicted nucleic acid-binding protein